MTRLGLLAISLSISLACAACSLTGDDSGKTNKKNALEELGVTITGSGASVKTGDGSTVTVTAGADNHQRQAKTPPLPQGASEPSRIDGVDDVTFMITTPQDLDGVRSFYEAQFAGQGLAMGPSVMSKGMYSGRWVGKPGSTAVAVYAYSAGAGKSQVTLVMAY
ncbi:MAG: hypothetical protein HY751_08450 [Nitrospinae bacterium]|nr:hypothetical protein [Nitrospinota bacterium]